MPPPEFLVAVGVILALGFGMKFYLQGKERRRQQLLDEVGDELWRTRTDWAAGRCDQTRGRSQGLFIGLFGFVMVVGGASQFLMGNLEQRLEMSVTMAIGALMLAYGLFHAVRRMKSGGAAMTPHQMPIRLGSRLTGDVELKNKWPTDVPVTATVRCNRVARQKRSQSSTTSRTIIGENSAAVPPSSILEDPRGGTRILLDVQLPDGRATFDMASASHFEHVRHEWLLVLRAEREGVDLHVEFEFPVV